MNTSYRLSVNNPAFYFNHLSPNSEEDENSLYIITTCTNIQVRSLKEVVTKDEMF